MNSLHKVYALIWTIVFIPLLPFVLSYTTLIAMMLGLGGINIVNIIIKIVLIVTNILIHILYYNLLKSNLHVKTHYLILWIIITWLLGLLVGQFVPEIMVFLNPKYLGVWFLFSSPSTGTSL